jgi:hypothetical protein
MTASDRTHRAALTTVLCGLLCLASANARVRVVTLSQLVDESDTIVYGSFKLTSRASAQSPAFVQFIPKATLRGKDLSVNGSLTFCNASGEKWPDLSRITGTLVIFANKQLECFGLSYGNKSIVRVKAGRARTGAMDDQPEAQPINVLLKKISVLVAKQPPK